jgi:CBS domain-containing membrane protein
MSVFVLDTNKTPLAPCHEDRARRLLKSGKAAIYRRYPFTIILKRAVENPQVPELRVKLDPGSKTTGIAVVDDCSGKIVFAAELSHRGHAIKESLDSRRAIRRSRRARHTRYRSARWQNRRRKAGWLPPSLQTRSGSPLTYFTPNVHRSTDINRLAYEKHPIPQTRLNPGNRQGRSKWISDKMIQRVRWRKLAQSIIGQDKDPFLSAFSHYTTDRLGKRQAIIPLTHNFLINSYQTLKNNKYHYKLALDHYNQPEEVTQRQSNRSYHTGQLTINCCLCICLMAGLAFIFHSPFIFPSLGPTAFLFFYKPTDPSSSPRNTLIGHSIATLAGYFSLVVTGLTAAGPVFAVGVTWPRIIAIGLSLGLTVGLMTLLHAPHPPATSTVLIVSLGTLTKPWQLIVLMFAVILLTMQASIINHLAGIDHHYPELKDCVQSGKKPLLKLVSLSFRLLPHTNS